MNKKSDILALLLGICLIAILVVGLQTGEFLQTLPGFFTVVGFFIFFRVVFRKKILSYVPAIAGVVFSLFVLGAFLLSLGYEPAPNYPGGWGVGLLIVIGAFLIVLSIVALLIALLFEANYIEKTVCDTSTSYVSCKSPKVKRYYPLFLLVIVGIYGHFIVTNWTERFEGDLKSILGSVLGFHIIALIYGGIVYLVYRFALKKAIPLDLISFLPFVFLLLIVRLYSNLQTIIIGMALMNVYLLIGLGFAKLLKKGEVPPFGEKTKVSLDKKEDTFSCPILCRYPKIKQYYPLLLLVIIGIYGYFTVGNWTQQYHSDLKSIFELVLGFHIIALIYGVIAYMIYRFAFKKEKPLDLICFIPFVLLHIILNRNNSTMMIIATSMALMNFYLLIGQGVAKLFKKNKSYPFTEEKSDLG